jgi:hypothetical protein
LFHVKHSGAGPSGSDGARDRIGDRREIALHEERLHGKPQSRNDQNNRRFRPIFEAMAERPLWAASGS